MNPSKLFYKIFFVFAVICSLLFVGSFVAIQFYNNSTYTGATKNTTSIVLPSTSNTTNTTNTNPTPSTDTKTNTTSGNSTDTNSTSNNSYNRICVQTSYAYLKSFFIVIGSIILFLNG